MKRRTILRRAEVAAEKHATHWYGPRPKPSETPKRALCRLDFIIYARETPAFMPGRMSTLVTSPGGKRRGGAGDDPHRTRCDPGAQCTHHAALVDAGRCRPPRAALVARRLATHRFQPQPRRLT